MTLLNAVEGKTYRILSVCADQTVRRRLLNLGFVENTSVSVVKKAPFRGAVLVSLRGCSVALRSFVASCVTVGETV